MPSDGSGSAEALSATSRVVDVLRARILEGALVPGAALREISVAAELDVSRNTLREALRLLASEGLVTQEPNRGVFVKTFTASEVRDIYRTRRVLEMQAATESAVADEERFAAMESAVVAKERAEQARRWREAGTASLRFHQALIAVLGSCRLDEFFRTLLAQLRLAWAESCDEEQFQRGWAARDRELFELLRQGRRSQSVGVLLIYLEDSERQVLDGLRRARSVQQRGNVGGAFLAHESGEE
ncbi:GntR family transcriptional regulator [Saccharopolyspora sp. K220]|uniref:GntR family transcriptional regulator n=1 Tax=Saccharopolyspora soli TaxID=2926618 RepID=UPI001F5772B6|nr:GntR family transcriptional regulator [Saccharopolyspora soli]MCI2416010.1 GntR family transcriptional regulator [Saccharopolyspora soli]